MGILEFISTRNYIAINKDLIKILEIDEAILLGELASEHEYWEKQGKLEDNYFYSTIENIEENTTLSEFKQRKALNKLKQLNLVEVKVKGIPAKRYIKVNENKVIELLNIKFFNYSSASSLKIKELDPEKLKGNKNNITKIINNKEIDISKLSKDNLSISKESENLEEKIDLFWKTYPKKKDKGNVEKWFAKNQPSKELVEKMVKQIERLKDTRQWKEEGGKFIPYPTTWLNAKGWEDEFETDTEHDERVQKAIEEGTFYDIFGH